MAESQTNTEHFRVEVSIPGVIRAGMVRRKIANWTLDRSAAGKSRTEWLQSRIDVEVSGTGEQAQTVVKVVSTTSMPQDIRMETEAVLAEYLISAFSPETPTVP